MKQRRMKLEYTMISADDHIDLGYLLKNLWTDRLPNSFEGSCAARRRQRREGRVLGLRWRDLGGLSWRALVCQAQSKQAGSRQGRSWRTPPADNAGKTAR